MDRPLPAEVKQYLGEAPVCRIATVRPEGQPHVIPVCPAFDGVATVYVDLDPHSVTANALRHEPRVAVLIDDYFDDWSKLRKVLLRCTAEPVVGDEQAAAWALIRSKFPQYATIDWQPRLTVALRIESWLQERIV
jgi:nitroimidazol reductase NimA-like FMN-containing flavoprotein (pyridoxamine 5'-phosphate oxidase superfamily)